MDTILQHFPHLTPTQQQQLAALDALYREWNEKINVISRKDIDHLYLHHVLHSLAIARFIGFAPDTRVLDFGTGGGFPGVPLAILFPECRFKLIDGTGKKIRVVNEVVQAIGLTNVEAQQIRGEEEKEKFHFVVTRGVMPLPDMAHMLKKNISTQQFNALPNGIIALKGGNTQSETAPYKNIAEVADIGQWFDEQWFREKHIVYLPM
ncbi:MAG: 16S rRNA (guanine(527)-N(7))-methyltransferase RsmG [Bacteroidaceae bacterium]|nr:16S rRNA (guanine(527)-N(7))-methyltransferase RsmG [Bacteroidaceae bacterium]